VAKYQKRIRTHYGVRWPGVRKGWLKIVRLKEEYFCISGCEEVQSSILPLYVHVLQHCVNTTKYINHINLTSLITGI